MIILLTGSSGLVGSALKAKLLESGHEVRCLRRNSKDLGAGDYYWSPEAGELNPEALLDVDAVIHLAGENVAQGYWTKSRKEKIRQSRIRTSELLVSKILETNQIPKIFLCASAVGIYGNRKDELLDESSSSGSGFLAEVCRDWEATLSPLQKTNCRCISARFGIILSASGGVLKSMLLPFRLGLGGKLGDGKQYMSWVRIEDVLAAICFCLDNSNLSGPVNVTAPEPAQNSEFTRALAQAVHRPAVCRIPALFLRAILGEMADEMLLSSARVVPKKLLENGFRFQFPQLEQALSLVAK